MVWPCSNPASDSKVLAIAWVIFQAIVGSAGAQSPLDVKYQACNGTGFPPVNKPALPGRRIYPPPCQVCGGKGRIMNPAAKNTNTRRD